MKSYYRVMLGKQSAHFEECHRGNFIGADYGIHEDLTGKLPESWRDFNAEYIPIYLAANPLKTKIAAGLACGMLWTVAKGMDVGDVVLCPDGEGKYYVGEITGDYQYAHGLVLPHRRQVIWRNLAISRDDMSAGLKNSVGSAGTVCAISRSEQVAEVEKLIGTPVTTILVSDPAVEDAYCFVMEKHLEDFLVENWKQTELGKSYDIYEEDGELVGKQYQTDTGPMDVLAISKDRKKLLVVELKKGKASDGVVGQTLRYMGYVQEELAEEGQTVAGVIIALEDDQRIRRALMMVPSIEFYRYQISFKLVKG
jgi:restriction system protein